MTHAMSHLCALKGVGSTQENIEAAIRGETHEFKEMYPAMVKDAVAEQEIEARHSLEYAMAIEMVHAKLFGKALADEELNAESNFYVCPLCGHTVRKSAPKKCPYCGVDASKFYEVR
jgi:rubrerythrin